MIAQLLLIYRSIALGKFNFAMSKVRKLLNNNNNQSGRRCAAKRLINLQLALWQSRDVAENYYEDAPPSTFSLSSVEMRPMNPLGGGN